MENVLYVVIRVYTISKHLILTHSTPKTIPLLSIPFDDPEDQSRYGVSVRVDKWSVDESINIEAAIYSGRTTEYVVSSPARQVRIPRISDTQQELTDCVVVVGEFQFAFNETTLRSVAAFINNLIPTW